jgi:hypothetical protein
MDDRNTTAGRKKFFLVSWFTGSKQVHGQLSPTYTKLDNRRLLPWVLKLTIHLSLVSRSRIYGTYLSPPYRAAWHLDTRTTSVLPEVL